MRSNNPPRLVQTAYEWHSGQSSALYSFASSGGVIWSGDHRFDLETEINACRRQFVEKNDRETSRLERLLVYVQKAKIGFCYTSGRMMPGAKSRAKRRA